MKAITVTPSKKRIDVVERPIPRLERDEDVLLHMLEAGICGTDRDICAFEYGFPPAGQESFVPGHESLARVVEVGKTVHGVQVGDLVVVMVRRPCPHVHCVACRAGRPDFCITGDFSERGIKGSDGFLSEFVIEDQHYLVPLPETLRSCGVLVEPLTIAVKGLLQVENIQSRLPWFRGRIGVPDAKHRTRRMTALVLGSGPVGLLAATILIEEGFETWIYSLDPEDSERAALAESLGGHFVPAQSRSMPSVMREIGHVDIVFEGVGSAEVGFQATRALGANGALVFTGVPAVKGPMEIDLTQLMRDLVLRNQVIVGSVNAGRDAYERAASLLERLSARSPELVRRFVSRRRSIDEFGTLLAKHPDTVKDVVAFSSAD